MTLRLLRGAGPLLLLLLVLAPAARGDPPPPAAAEPAAGSDEREELSPGPEPRRQPPPDEVAGEGEVEGEGGAARPSQPPPPPPPPAQPAPSAPAAAPAQPPSAAETLPGAQPPPPQSRGAPPSGGQAARITDWENSDYECARTRDAPPTHRVGQGGTPYIISEQRLRKIRSEFLYCFFDGGGDDGEGDYQKNVHASTPQVHKNFNFQLPFFGFRFNYTRVSLNGYLEFSDPPEHYTYPLVFPNKDWPTKNDPSFIGIFFSKMRVGKMRPDDIDQRKAGVYFRLERDLQTRVDQFGVEMRERLMWDVREGVVGADTFEPKHAVIVTWKNVSFAGGIDNALYRTNTFQLVLATDEVYTYAIFNYVDIQWTSHTEAGGDTTIGEGGVPAYVGFNAGNGTRSYQYEPYSQASTLRDLTGRGWGNGFPGRHIFRIDERIMTGTCNKDIAGTDLELTFAPESGNMLGGTVVNITGPCFEPDMKIRCKFDKMDVWGTVVDTNRAICIQPFVYAEGYVPLEVSTGGGFNWKGKYFIETPATATERISFSNNDVHLKSPNQITIKWDRFNLTTNGNAPVRISLWGYREPKTTMPHLVYIDTIEESISNQGMYTIHPGNYRNRNNVGTNDIQFGFIHINLTNPEQYHGLTISPVLWSKPIPLAWYFGPQWERKYGTRWPVEMCNNWIKNDRFLKNFAAEIPQCPCILEHVLNDKGRYLSDWECDMDINPDCYYHQTAIHCMRTGAPSHEGLEQMCCYDKNGYLMLSYDQMWGSRPYRAHNLGFLPWNEATKVPTLSQWYHDIVPFYQCCMWQNEQAVGCETYRFERRPTQDCIAYQPPSIAAVFGDPHIVTFDNLEYTFNGKGEFVLVHADSNKAQLDVQARFEQVPRNIYGDVAATQLTAVATKDNISATIEIRVRPEHARWRYHLDVFADGRRVYFDRDSLKTQHFRGVIVYTPSYILNQSEVIVMFQSGAGVEVVENKGYLSCRVYLPWSFINQTRGLFGNWSFDMTDDFTLPNGYVVNIGNNLNNFERVHRDFALEWMLEDKDNEDIGKALFTRENMRASNFYGNRSFVPEYRKSIYEIVPTNRSSRNKDIEDALNFCGDSYQCQFDYALTLNREMAQFTKFYQDQFSNMKAENEKHVVSCGVLETPRFGRKSNFYFTPGSKVTFECDENFILIGDKRRTCNANGQWDLPEYGYTECLRHQEYSSRQVGIISGIILGILVPIIFIIVLIYCWLRRKKEKLEEPAPSWKYDWQVSGSPTDTKQRNFSDEGESAKKLSTSTSSSLSPEKKPKHYDGVYYTNEPLPGKPPVDFEEKVWDLDDDVSPSTSTAAEPSVSSEPSVQKSRQTEIY